MDGPRRIMIASAALVGMWIAVYWLWPAPAPPITFDDPVDVTPAATRPGATAEPPAGPEPAPQPAPSRPPTTAGAGLEPAPAPDLAPVVPPEFETHIVREGETIWSIAETRWGDRNLGGVIARANPLTDPKRLKPGDRLLIPKDPRNVQGVPAGAEPPPPEPQIVQYVVAAGDSLSEIAQRFYGRSSLWTRIRDANPDVIGRHGEVRVGATIIIPPPPEPETPEGGGP